MQRVLMLLGVCYWASERVTQLAMAEFIGRWFERARLAAPVPPIDYDAAKLARIRAASRLLLGRQLHRGPTELEIAVEVAGRYHRLGDAAQAAVRKMRRLLREAERYEYVFVGWHEFTGKLPLPSSR